MTQDAPVRGRLQMARALLVFCACCWAAAPLSAQERDVTRISLDSLLSVPVHAAARYAQAHSDAPASVSIVTGEEISAFGYRTVAEVLASVAGLYVTYDRNYTYLGVRGIGRLADYNNRILLLLNGYPLNEGVYGGAQLGPELGIDPRTLDRVEVVRGPVSALYGTNAMLAVVNLVTRDRVDTPLALHAGSGANAGASAQHVLPLRRGGGSLFVSAVGATTQGSDQPMSPVALLACVRTVLDEKPDEQAVPVRTT